MLPNRHPPDASTPLSTTQVGSKHQRAVPGSGAGRTHNIPWKTSTPTHTLNRSLPQGSEASACPDGKHRPADPDPTHKPSTSPCCAGIWSKCVSNWQQTPADPNPTCQHALDLSLLQGSGASLSDLASPTSSGQLPQSPRQSSEVSQVSPSVRLGPVSVDRPQSALTDHSSKPFRVFV